MPLEWFVALIALNVVILILLFVLLAKKGKSAPSGVQTDELRRMIGEQNERTIQIMDRISRAQRDKADDLERRVSEQSARSEHKLEVIRNEMNENLRYMNDRNEKQLEEMRRTVEEKLQTTLEKRLSTSFQTVSENLDQVAKGIGEVRRLAESVGDIKKVFTNVKLRGTWGETQLGTLLEQMLSPDQYRRNVRINPRIDSFVDFAVVLPGKEDGETLLPIDSKFPIEEYLRLTDAEDDLARDKAAKGLAAAVKKQADSIADKYIMPPETTDFAILYLPLEGLYAETLKNADLTAYLQKKRVMACGPTNLGALLNSLQTGFKTLAIEKRSSELWKLLSVFKAEFYKFAAILERTQKKLQEAQDSIEGATKKTRTIQKKLRSVAELGEDVPEQLAIEEGDGLD